MSCSDGNTFDETMTEVSQTPPARARAGSPPRRATVMSVAEDAGVSRQTVSNALNAPERLRPETLLRVQSSITRLRYRPDAAARSLRTRSTQTIAYQLPSSPEAAATWSPPFLAAFCRGAYRNGYEVMAFCADEDAEKVYDDLLSRHAVDAFVLTARPPFAARGRTSVLRGIPHVVLGRPLATSVASYCWVDVDDAAGTALAVDHLVGRGHRRIGFLGWPCDGGRGDQRYAGWAAALRARGLPTRGLSIRSGHTVDAGADSARQLLGARLPPTALVCASDVIAVGAILARRDTSTGGWVDVVGFGDTALVAEVQPNLSSLRAPADDLVDDILSMLTKSLNSLRARASGSLRPPQLVVRASSQSEDVAKTSIHEIRL